MNGEYNCSVGAEALKSPAQPDNELVGLSGTEALSSKLATINIVLVCFVSTCVAMVLLAGWLYWTGKIKPSYRSADGVTSGMAVSNAVFHGSISMEIGFHAAQSRPQPILLTNWDGFVEVSLNGAVQHAMVYCCGPSNFTKVGNIYRSNDVLGPITWDKP